jgi:hypothetical protein
MEMAKCSICDCDFDLESEGGDQGEIGVIPVAFCPTCLAGLYDMFEQRVCEDCEYKEEKKDGPRSVPEKDRGCGE